MKAQINLEFLASAFVFLLALGSLITIGSDILPSFSEDLSDSAVRLEAYSITSQLMTEPGFTDSGKKAWAETDSRVEDIKMIGLTKNSSSSHELSEKKIERLRSVDIGLSDEYINYTEFKDMTGVKNQYRFNFTWKPIVYSSDSFQKLPVYDQKDSLVAYYEFENETGDVEDSSDLDNDAINLGATRGVEGAYNSSSFEYDGSSYVSAPSFPIGSNLTVSMWIKKDGSWDDESLFLLGDDEGGSGVGSELRMHTQNDKFRWTYFNSTGFFGIVQSETPETDEWVHLTGSYNQLKDQWKLYRDGELWNSKVEEFSMNLSGQPDNGIGVGGNPTDDPNIFYFDGKIDEFRIYNRTLEEEEVEDLYSIKSKIRPPRDSDYRLGSGSAYYRFKRLRGKPYHFLFTESDGRNSLYVSKDWNFTSDKSIQAGQTISPYDREYYIGDIVKGSSSYSALLEEHIRTFGSNVDSDSTVIRFLRYGSMLGEPLQLEVLAW